MSVNNSFDAWRMELLFVGNIVQDGDDSIEQEERDRRFSRYIEMLDFLTGTEGYECALAVMESVQAVDDYGAYQTAGSAVWLFGEECYCRAILHELPRLITTLPDWAGDFLVCIANGQNTRHQSVIDTFNRLLAQSSPDHQQLIRSYILQEENGGWLSHRVGVIGVLP